MFIATTALLLTLGSSPAIQPRDQAASATTANGHQQGATALIVGADIDGQLAIYDRERRLVVEMDKTGGRQVQVALEPGPYEARLAGTGERRARFEVVEGQLQRLGAASFKTLTDAPPTGSAPHHALQRDGRHRIEVRFGGWADGSYGGLDEHWDFSGSAHGALGFEYLRFVGNDIGIGVGLTALVRADECHDCVGVGTAQALTSIPVTVRWYPVRRLTPSRSVEPYVTAGAGPVFGTDSTLALDHDGRWRHDRYASTRVGTTVGGRIGGGVDFRLGRTFTMGAGGAWNWNAGFSGDIWRGPHPNGGEFTVSLGWNFGR